MSSEIWANGFGIASGQPTEFKTSELHSSCRSVLGFSIGTTIRERPELIRETGKNILKLLSDGMFDRKIGNVCSLDDVVEAHKVLENRKSKGKVILKIKE